MISSGEWLYINGGHAIKITEKPVASVPASLISGHTVEGTQDVVEAAHLCLAVSEDGAVRLGPTQGIEERHEGLVLGLLLELQVHHRLCKLHTKGTSAHWLSRVTDLRPFGHRVHMPQIAAATLLACV